MNVLPFFMGGRAGAAPNIADLFATTLYTGNSATQTITNGIDLVGLGGLVWIKNRPLAVSHNLSNTITGTTSNLATDSSDASVTSGTRITSFNSDGFSVGGASQVNNSGSGYASWTFARNSKFFDVVTFTHTNGVTSNVATGLTVPLGLATVKRLDSTSDWYTNHRSLTSGNNLRLNTTAAESATDAWVSFSGSTVVFDSAAPSGDYVLYVWGHDDSDTGVVQSGTYTGNGSTTGPSVITGWPVDWLLVKRATGGAASWYLFDVPRNGLVSAGNSSYLRPDVSNGEQTFGGSDNRFEPLVDGFRVNISSDVLNASGSSFIYIAIRAPS